jgi:hypothetical protein
MHNMTCSSWGRKNYTSQHIPTNDPILQYIASTYKWGVSPWCQLPQSVRRLGWYVHAIKDRDSKITFYCIGIPAPHKADFFLGYFGMKSIGGCPYTKTVGFVKFRVQPNVHYCIPKFWCKIGLRNGAALIKSEQRSTSETSSFYILDHSSNRTNRSTLLGRYQ